LVVRVIEGREMEACSNDSFVLWRDPKVSTAVVVEVGGGVVLGRRAIEPGYCRAGSSTTTRTRRRLPRANAWRRSARRSS
jgi:hypothetical protein